MSEIEQAINDGKQAENLLTNSAFVKAISQAKDEAVNDFAQSSPTDTPRREAAYYTLKAIEKLESRLRTMLQNGKFEQEKLARKPKN